MAKKSSRVFFFILKKFQNFTKRKKKWPVDSYKSHEQTLYFLKVYNTF